MGRVSKIPNFSPKIGVKKGQKVLRISKFAQKSDYKLPTPKIHPKKIPKKGQKYPFLPYKNTHLVSEMLAFQPRIAALFLEH